jgi:hypothetical protein
MNGESRRANVWFRSGNSVQDEHVEGVRVKTHPVDLEPAPVIRKGRRWRFLYSEYRPSLSGDKLEWLVYVPDEEPDGT